MKTIPLEQKVVSLRLPSYDSSNDSNEDSGAFEKVLEITMLIKKIPKLNTIQRVKDAKKQSMKKTKPSGRQVSEVVESNPKMNIMMAPKIQIRSPPKQRGGKTSITGIKGVSNPYMFYAKTQVPRIRQIDTSLNQIEASRQAGAQWQKLTDKQKKPYQDLADQDKQRYIKEKEAHEQKSQNMTSVNNTMLQQNMPSTSNIKKSLSQASKSTAAATQSQKSTGQIKTLLATSPPKVQLQETDSKIHKLTSYQIFITKSTPDFQAKNPSASPSDLRKLKNAHWATLSKEQKESWAQIADDNKFGKDLTQTKLNPPSFGQKSPQQVSSPVKTAAGRSNKAKKGNVSGYNIFYRQTSQKIRAEQPTLTTGEISKVVGETWGLVSNEVKKKYEAMAEQENQLKNQKSVPDNEETFSENN